MLRNRTFEPSKVEAINETQVALSDAVVALNVAVVSKDADNTAKSKIDMEAALAAYNAALTDGYIDWYLSQPSPFLAALTDGYIPQMAVRAKNGIYEMALTERLINLKAIEAASPKQIAVNGQWVFWVEKFTMLLNARATKDIDGDIKRFSKMYYIREESRNADIGAIPTSNAQIEKQLQNIVDAVLFIDNGNGKNTLKVTKADVSFILLTMIKEGRANNIVCCKTQNMEKLITKALHRMVTNGQYAATYREIKVK